MYSPMAYLPLLHIGTIIFVLRRYRCSFYSYDTTAQGNYHWDFGDSTVSILPNPTHEYPAPGLYSVHLVTFSAEGCIDSSIRTIQTGAVTVDFTAPASACSGSSISFLNTSTSIPKAASWSVNGKVVSDAPEQFLFSFPDPGVFTIKLTADYGGCVFEKEKTITILQKPVAQFDQSGTLQSCLYPSTVQFTNLSQFSDGYTWQFGDSATSAEESPSHIYDKAGQFSPQLIARNGNGCADTLVKLNLILLGPPIINGFRGLPVSHCLPYTIQPKAFVSTPEPIATYHWDFGNGDVSGEASPSYTYTTQGTYNITLSLQTQSGCTDTFVVRNAVSVGDSIVPDFTVDKNIACGSDSIQFTASAHWHCFYLVMVIWRWHV